MNSNDMLKMLDILMEDLTPEQLQKLSTFAMKYKDPREINLQEAKKLIVDTGLDIEKMQKRARKKRAEDFEKNRKPKVGANELCLCGSQKKYKKCCRNVPKPVPVPK